MDSVHSFNNNQGVSTMQFVDRISPDYHGRNKDEESRTVDLARHLRAIRLLHAGTSGVFSKENVAEVIVIMRRPHTGSLLSRLFAKFPLPPEFQNRDAQEELDKRFEWYLYLFRSEADLMKSPNLFNEVKRLRRNGFDVKVKVKLDEPLHRIPDRGTLFHAEAEIPFEDYYLRRIAEYRELDFAR